MEAITFDQLPAAVNQLLSKLDAIENLLRTSFDSTTEPEKWFNLEELCTYLPDKPARATVYGWVHSGMIPYHKGGKKLRFLKSDIDNWMKAGRRMTLAERLARPDSHLRKPKQRRGKA